MPDLPTGTVTFLFADIAGSTALWERDRAAMREAVDRQLALLRTSIQAHVGRGGPYRLKEIAAHP